MLALYFACFAIAINGRRIGSRVGQGINVQASAEASTAFVPSGASARTTPIRRPASVNDHGFSKLYSALAKRANMPKMGDDDDDIRKGVAGLYDKAVLLGKKKSKVKGSQPFILGVISGAHIALGSMLAVSTGVFKARALEVGLQKILLGMFGLPMALLMTVTAGGELITGSFGFGAAAYFEKKAKPGEVYYNWVKVITGNFLGALLIAWLAYEAHTGFGEAARQIAYAKVRCGFGTLVAKGILCNWLVCMAMWMATSTADIVSKSIAILFPVSGFVALGFEHSVANMFFIAFGMYHGADINSYEMFFKNLLPVTLGNAIGAVWGVAYLYKLAFGPMKKKEKKKDQYDV